MKVTFEFGASYGKTTTLPPERVVFHAVMHRVELEKSQALAADALQGADDYVTHLCQLVNDVCRTGTIRIEQDLARLALTRLVSFVMAWLKRDALTYGGMAAFSEQIYLERVRQRSLFLSRRIGFDCADPAVDPRRKFRALFEEAGEVAQAVDKIEELDTIWTRHHLAIELVQLAAVGVAWLEAMADQESKP